MLLVFDFFLLPGVLWAHNKITCPILGLVSLENLLSKAITLRIWEMSFHRFFRYLFSVHINLHKSSPGVPRASVIANVLCEYSNMNFLREVFNFHPRFCSAFCLALLSDLGFNFGMKWSITERLVIKKTQLYLTNYKNVNVVALTGVKTFKI